MPPKCGDSADSNWRNTKEHSRGGEGELSGRIKLVTAWHAIGHPVSNLSYLPCHCNTNFENRRTPRARQLPSFPAGENSVRE